MVNGIALLGVQDVFARLADLHLFISTDCRKEHSQLCEIDA